MKVIFVFIFCICFFEGKSQTHEVFGIKWVKNLSWSQIEAKARLEKKFIFIDCFTTWCFPCKKMDKEVYINSEVANYFNQNFISVRLQMDSTNNDDQITKNWYSIAREMERIYHVTGYPTLIFLSPEGIVTNKETAYKSVVQLMEIAKDAIDPKRINLFREIENFKNGKKNYSVMKDLAEFAQKVIGDKKLGIDIANDYILGLDSTKLLQIESIFFIRDVKQDLKLATDLAHIYKRKVIDNLDSSSLCKRDILSFVKSFPSILSSSDYIFRFCYYQPILADSMLGGSGEAQELVVRTITNEELYKKLVDEKQVVNHDNDWQRYRALIQTKFPNINSEKLLLDFQITYYRYYKTDWVKWAKYKNARIQKYPPNPHDGVGITLELNDGGAWDVFLNCNNKNVIKNILFWPDLAIKITKKGNPKSYPYAFLDTKANLLYKLGMTEKAIHFEEEAKHLALHAANKAGSKGEKRFHLEQAEMFEKIIRQMKVGQPTYLDQGAIWQASLDSSNDKKGD